MRWGQAYLCVSIAANMDKVPSGSLVYRCVLHIGGGYVCVCVCVCVWGGGGGGGRGGGGARHFEHYACINIHSTDSGESRWIENQYK